MSLHLTRRKPQEPTTNLQASSPLDSSWKFQAEILRAECNLVRMERELAVKKMEKMRLKMETTLRSALEALINGRKKIFEGENVMEEELEDKIHKLQPTTSTSPNDDKAVIAQKNAEEKMKEEYDNQEEPWQCCKGRCKQLVKKIAQQVRGEREEWSQMQDMVDRVRAEMEQLQLSRQYWEDRAHESARQLQCLRLLASRWRDRSVILENEVNKLRFRLQQQAGDTQQDSLLKLIQMDVEETASVKNISRVLALKKKRSPLKEIENAVVTHPH